MGIKTVVGPTVTPISVLGLAALKQHLNEAADVTDRDELIETYCAVAWDHCERQTWRTLLTKELRLTLCHWRPCLVLPRPRIVSVESVEYYDLFDELQTLSAAEWSIDLDQDVPELFIEDFPSLSDRPDAVRINYTAGYGTAAADFPPVLLHAVRLLVGDYYKTREPAACDTGTVDALLACISVRDERLAEFE